MPDVRRTRATFRSAELGFLGVWVNTRVHTPRRWGEPFSAGVFDFSGLVSRPLRTSCWMVGNVLLVLLRSSARWPACPRRAWDDRMLARGTRTTPMPGGRPRTGKL